MGKKVIGKKGLRKEENENENHSPLVEASLSKDDDNLLAGNRAARDDGIELEASQSEAPMEVDADVVEKKKKKKKRLAASGNNGSLDDAKLHEEDNANHETSDDVVELEASQSKALMEVGAHMVGKKKKKKKGHEASDNDVELGASQIASDTIDREASKLKNEKGGYDVDSGVEQSMTRGENNVGKEKKKRKKKKKLEEDQNVIGVEIPVHVDKHKKAKNRQMNGEEADEKKKKCKRKGGDDLIQVTDATHVEPGKDEGQINHVHVSKKMKSEGQHMNGVDGKKKKKHKRTKVSDDSPEMNNATDLEAGKDEDRTEENLMENSDNPENQATKKQYNSRSSENRKKRDSKYGRKKVSFSENVEVFPSNSGMVRGKRFSLEEDAIIKNAVLSYIDEHQLGEEGINMILNCKSHPEVRNCWKEIAGALPSRPYESVYYRAHNLFERDENRKWTPEELEVVRKFHEKHGSDWKKLAVSIGKHRFQVKDAWRRIKLTGAKKGPWSQDEYQKLYNLVNLDLIVRANGERKTKHGMLRDNISWEAISDKLATRSYAFCCQKWYYTLSSPLVAEGKWSDLDDYHLMNALSALDACCVEDVDWDCLLEHRPGDTCLKRWNQLVKHLGPYANKSFAEQVEVLSQRYCPDVLEAREVYDSKPAVDEGGTDE